MYSPQRLAAMRLHPDAPRVIAAILNTHDALPAPLPISTEVMDALRSGQLELVFDDSVPAVGGLTPGESPIILGGLGVLGNPSSPPERIQGLVLSTVHEGVHFLDVVAGRSLPGAQATIEQRFFTELHAYTVEFLLATGNGLVHLQGPEFRGARTLEDIAAAVLTVESQLIGGLALHPGADLVVLQAVSTRYPTVPRDTP
jgi:hypothetical protein